MKKLIAIVLWSVASLVIGFVICFNSVHIITHLYRSLPDVVKWTGPRVISPLAVILKVVICFPYLLSAFVVYLGIRGRLWGTR